ncbi:MAG: hypothetical protein P1U56_15715 [Saprospiraceae bacterium]|nr:hypothetical protein [Saprospiraceae bacterium]
MSQLSFPRINFKGLVVIDVGTGNNDDYSNVQFPEGSPWAGQPLRPMDSRNVQPNYITPEPGGMTDEEWIKWAVKTQEFVIPSDNSALESIVKPSLFTIRRDESRPMLNQTNLGLESTDSGDTIVRRIPEEWNYYGDMGMTMYKVGVTSTEQAKGKWDDSMNGAVLSYNNRIGELGRTTGIMNDVNPESVPCSQIFADYITLEKDNQALLTAKAHKAVTRRINFQRNVYLNGPNGAGAYFQHAIPIQFLEGQPILDYMKTNADPDKELIGVICRYYIARNLQPINTFQYPAAANGDPGDGWYKAIEELYTKSMPDNKNAGLADMTGTIAPWYKGEMKTITAGRIMNCDNGVSFKLPSNAVSNGPEFQLAPIVFEVDYKKGFVSLDCIDAFPEAFDAKENSSYDPYRMDTNPKYDFGEVTLIVKSDTDQHTFGPINYLDPNFVERGCLVDFEWDTTNKDLKTLIKNGDFHLINSDGDSLLIEDEFFIASDQNCIFAEQVNKPGSMETLFINDTNEPCASDGSGIGIQPENCVFEILQRGNKITDPNQLPQLELQVFDTTPNQDVGAKGPVETIENPVPGDPLSFGVDSHGNRLAYFAINGKTANTYNDVNLMNEYYICMRILPNDVDYSSYYEDPSATEKVGNYSLTFEVMYQAVLRNYYLLYPAMSEYVPLNNKNYWNTPDMARRLKARTGKDMWGCHAYMPRSRDLSDSRRELIEAWCNKIIQNGPE